MWRRHWNLDRDPFDGRRPGFVATPTHSEAVARLVHTIETAGRSARLMAGPGLGKSSVLARSLDAARGPGRRIGRASSPIDGASLFADLAAGLGARVAPGAGRAAAWRALGDAARVCRWQGLGVVLAVDDCQALASPADRLDLERLGSLNPDPASSLTVIRVGRPGEGPGPDEPPGDWGLLIRLDPLGRSEAADYVAAKLLTAGRAEPAFTPRALTRLHALSGGIPRGLDRLASIALMAGSARGVEMVTPEIVEGAARECDEPAGGMAIPARVG